MISFARVRHIILSALAVALIAPAVALTQPPAPAPTPPTAPSPKTPSLERADVDAWLDGLVPGAMRRGKIPGGVVVVVKGGQILTERGFGYADIAKKRAVDPRTTIFHPGSISKTLTFTAVMQLVEQGRIDLDADVNTYLDFRIPPRDGKPITMRQIMTHTPGFEESIKNLTTGSRPSPPLGTYLKTWVPERIYAPGTVPAYSNYASALAGYVVQRVSGQDYYDYMDAHVLGPLGMTLSSFRQPAPAKLQPLLSQGYAAGSEEPTYFEHWSVAPAGSLLATSHDMAGFMIAHLQQGRFGNAQILAPATAAQMHMIQPRIFPALNGMALGFYEHSRNGHRILAHNGGTQFFHSDMHLFLDDGVGIFISLNSPGVEGAASGLHDALFRGFADRYFPARPSAKPKGVDTATAVRHARLMAGPWDSSRRSDSSFLSLGSLMGPFMITANADGTIGFDMPGQGMTKWREIAPFVWQDVDGADKIQALVKDGRPIMLGFDIAAPQAFIPAPAWRSPSWLMPALLASLALLLINGLAWPVRAMVRRRYGAALAYAGSAATFYRLTRALSLAAIAAILTFLATLTYMTADIERFSEAMDPWLLCVKLAAVAIFAGGSAAALYDLAAHWSARKSWAGRLWSVLIALAFIVLLWIAFAFNLTNFSGHY
ncbi:serine hydrolase domain-containing protein [Sphingomonas colocasiae]|uniref:Beta-lactamase family protein n=1 Tax=Sphingomonas colocasiae TaxID=1848973 RepID=A0ABS7PXA7_9SPHN|nr:serine hydrolase domain-containing protein [Sphingomonas colocasiae]MBY8826000.1 beta-lactamase family protein [Sphingomonas colocasiae]